MKIDWFTVIAQIINFLILVWLLKKFLYKPILNAVNEREKKITDQLKDADNKKTAAQKEQDDFKKKNEDFDQQKKGLLDKAVADATTEKQKLLDGAKADANTLRTNMEKASKEKLKNDTVEFAQKTQKQVFAITRKALTDIASISLEEQSANTFIKHLKELKDDAKNQFIDAFKSNANAILVRSAFELPAKQQAEIHDAVNVTLSADTHLQFKTAPDIISGIELSTNGYKLAWSFSEYLNTLETNISETTKENAKPEPENK
ncbi:MAG: F0F1 ATP synthase subunit B [Bacteroidota bacterium]